MRQRLLIGLKRLEALKATVERASYRWAFVDLGWKRPHGELVLEGGGHTGRGELIAFSASRHRAFADDLPTGTLRPKSPPGGSAYARCAWEAALIDLALRQQGRSFGELFDVERAELKICWSHERLPDPDSPAPWKVDFDSEAPEDYTGQPLVVLDFKGKGRDAKGVGPDVILEDPDREVRAPWSLDQRLRNHRDLRAPYPTHVNLKAGRMGGFLHALRLALKARERGIEPYWGGQWELGVGRLQAQQAAAVVCPDAWNDIAPTHTGYPQLDAHTLDVDLSQPGFGRYEPRPTG